MGNYEQAKNTFSKLCEMASLLVYNVTGEKCEAKY